MEIKKDIRRFDNIDNSQWMTMPFAATAEGFLKGRAIVTSIGVFTYARKDGTVQRELRLPEEVFSGRTLDSMKLKPVTLNHPAELVTKDNADKLQVGSLGDNPSWTKEWHDRNWEEVTDGINCAIDMIITKKEAVDAVLNGKQALSMGYTCDLEMAEPGATWCGVEYDFIQRNIRYNHCAIVDSARAGDNAKIELRVDSEDAVLEDMVTKSDGGTKMELKKINLDGIDYQAEESVIKALNAEKARADKAEKERDDACGEKKTMDKKVADMEKKVTEFEKRISELEAERDSAKEKADGLEKELEESKADSADPKRLDEAVKAKMELLHNAEKAKVEVKEDMSDADIKKAIVTSQFPKANFDGKDEIYIQARYDAAVEMLCEKNDGETRRFTSDMPPENHADENDAREKMIQRLKNHGKED
ncbi:DUF2213 domain-containing protein [Methanobrevibacter sp.]|uniref:DUF2213 domain-containing protein n=1 Tax=Methanobrevibacter sp. TaxID=66852 RepID=UPI0038637876